MASALRWAAMRAILMFLSLWGTKSQDSVHRPQPLKPNALLLGQTSSQLQHCWWRRVYESLWSQRCFAKSLCYYAQRCFFTSMYPSVHMYLCYVVLCQVSVNCSCHRSTWSGGWKLKSTPSRSTALVKTGGKQSTVLVKTGGGDWLRWLKQGEVTDCIG